MKKRFRLRAFLTFVTQQRIAWVLLIILMVAYSIWMSDQAILRYTTFKADAFDLGNMDQAIWNTLHGRPFQFTNQGSDNYGPPTRLATHFEPILLLLSLLYAFHSDPRILLVFQTLALVAGTIPVFLLTRKFIPIWPLLAPVMAAAYVLSPALMGLNIYDFHPVSIATPLLLFSVLALEYRRLFWYVVASLLACACKEDIPLAVALLAFLAIWQYHIPRLGTILGVVGVIWSAIAFLWVIPHFFPGAQHSNYWYRYEALGSSPSDAIKNVLLHPWLPLVLFVTLDRIYYLFSLVRSSGFLALLAPEWLLPTIPSLAVNLLASGDSYYSGVYHYNAAIVPFVIIAAIHGIKRLIHTWYGWSGEPVSEMALYQSSSLHSVPERYSSPTSAALQLRVTHVLILLKNCVSDLYNKTLRRGWHWLMPRVQPAFLSVQQFLQIRRQRVRSHMISLAHLVIVPYLQWVSILWIIGMIVLNITIMHPLLNIFWADHRPADREQQIQHLLAMIPPDASVSAGGNLNPHLTERRYITVFPEITFSSTEKNVNTTVQYIIVDLDDLAPEDKTRSASFVDVLNQLRRSHQFRQIAEADGVILLTRDQPFTRDQP